MAVKNIPREAEITFYECVDEINLLEKNYNYIHTNTYTCIGLWLDIRLY